MPFPRSFPHPILLLWLAIGWSACKTNEDITPLGGTGDCVLTQIDDEGYVLDLEYDSDGRLTLARSNFEEQFLCSYSSSGTLERISGSADLRFTHAEGNYPERIESWNNGQMQFHYNMMEADGKLTEWRSYPNGATEPDRIVTLGYAGDRLQSIDLQLWDPDLKQHLKVLSADSIHTDGRVNPYSTHMLLFLRFAEDKPFAVGTENITAARIEAVGQRIPFSTTYTYNDQDLLTHSIVEVQLFGGETRFSYTCD